MTVVGRVDDGDSRWYIDPRSGAQLESVTRIISATEAKPWLAPWSARLTAEAAAENLDLCIALRDAPTDGGIDAVIDFLKGAGKRRRELKREIGTYVHDVIEALILDTPIPTPPEHLVGLVIDGESVDLDHIIDGFTAFDDDFHPDYLMAEATVANQTHGYAGTLDIVARFPTLGGRIGGIDTKTGAVLGPSMSAQLAAYRNTEEVWLTDLGDRAPMPAWDFAAILHIRTDYKRGFKLLEVDAGEQAFGWFLACRKVLEHVQAAPPIRGRPVYPALPDGSQPPMLLEDADGLARFARTLDEHTGAMNVVDAASLTVAELLAVPGIGEVAVRTIITGLAPHGLTVTGPLPCVGGTAETTHREARKIVADCPTCGQKVSAAQTGIVRFHTLPTAVAA